MITRILLVCIMLISLSARICIGQQTFQQAYGKAGIDQGFGVTLTSDGGYVSIGEYDVTGTFSAEVSFVKVDSLGNIVWTKTYGGAKELKMLNGTGNRGYEVQPTSDGGYIIGGEVHSFGAGKADMYLIKTNLSGNMIWSKAIGGDQDDYCYAIQETSDSCFILAGTTESYGYAAGTRDAYLVKTNSVGDTLWTRTYGNSSIEGANDVKETSDKNYIVAGYTFNTITGNSDIFLMKTNTSGDILWQKTYGGSLHEFGYTVKQTVDDGFIVSGSTESYGAGNQDIFLIKTDSAGNLLWSKSYGGSVFEEGNSVAQLPDKGFIIAGYSASFGAGYEDVIAIRTDSVGNMIWSKVFGGPDADIGQDVKLCPDGGFIITGSTISYGSGSTDLYMLKLDSLGEADCNQPNPATLMNSDTTLENLLAFQVDYGGIITNPLTIEGNTTTVRYSICDSISSVGEQQQEPVKIYPTPTSDFLYIESSFNSDALVTLYNTVGQTIYTFTIASHSKEALNIAAYPTGLYYLTLLSHKSIISKRLLFVE